MCVCSLDVQHAMRMHRILICDLSGCTVFSILSHVKHDFRKKKSLLNTKCVLRFSVQILSEEFFVLRRNDRNMIKKKYIGLREKYRYYCQILIKLEFSRQIFKQYSNIKFHENPSSGSRVVPCRRTDGRA